MIDALAREGRDMLRSELLDLSRHIYDVPDFPKKGIIFKDITPLLREPAALSLAVELLTQPFRDQHVDAVVGTESRGFIFGTAVARNLSAGFVPVRKKGKLPRSTRSATYDLEYGTDTLEIHEDAIRRGDKILMVDDLLATGGTMGASCQLIESLGGRIVGLAVLIELMDLNGRERLAKYPIHSIMQVRGEKVATM
jgi:adenine phosphoribosyltransferase